MRDWWPKVVVVGTRGPRKDWMMRSRGRLERYRTSKGCRRTSGGGGSVVSRVWHELSSVVLLRLVVEVEGSRRRHECV